MSRRRSGQTFPSSCSRGLERLLSSIIILYFLRTVIHITLSEMVFSGKRERDGLGAEYTTDTSSTVLLEL